MLAGISPERSFLLRESISKPVKLPMPSGMVPERSLLCSLRSNRFTRFAISLGISPLNSLLSIISCSRNVRFPIDSGIPPVRRFPERSSFLSSVSEPTSSGIDPAKSRPWRSRTRHSLGSARHCFHAGFPSKDFFSGSSGTLAGPGRASSRASSVWTRSCEPDFFSSGASPATPSALALKAESGPGAEAPSSCSSLPPNDSEDHGVVGLPAGGCFVAAAAATASPSLLLLPLVSTRATGTAITARRTSVARTAKRTLTFLSRHIPQHLSPGGGEPCDSRSPLPLWDSPSCATSLTLIVLFFFFIAPLLVLCFSR
mmetsp:Transcript_8712/g.24869  ORF Transcript_8712/g.24869 Transcript_8712/m.24869 type:complete len:314 (+) Transcript_8712:309-1250(+)